MFILLISFLVLLLYAFRRTKGPVWAMAIGWILCVLPVATGLISYGWFTEPGLSYQLTVIGLVSCFAAGAAVFIGRQSGPEPEHVNVNVVDDVETLLPTAYVCWVIGLAGAALITVDFLHKGGAGLDDLQALRATVGGGQSATIYAQIGSLLTWGGVYCMMFVFAYWQTLPMMQRLFFLVPIGGFFMGALLTAGRMAAFEIVVLTLLLLMLLRRRQRTSVISRSMVTVIVPLFACLIAYMGYVAMARTSDFYADRTALLSGAFQFKPSPGLDAFETALGPSVRSTMNEGLVYFTASGVLFKPFLEVKFPDYSYGNETFPFIMRNLQVITHMSQTAMMEQRAVMLLAKGVIGVGWTTGFSSYLRDFGTVGACLFLFLQGYYSEYMWYRARTNGGFHDVVIATLALGSAALSCLFVFLADNSILFLWLACMFFEWLTLRGSRRTGDPAEAEGPFEPRATPS